ncbi:MAG: hypothetical protein MUF64_18160 [Polyangiaceae bacterium]|jgi:hypothetical protein|nr:hypothetical protein [Polyangiaceae bacterium]
MAGQVMAETTGGPRSSRRFPVDLRDTAEELDARLNRLLRMLPTGSAERSDSFGFVFRREPDAFSAIAAGPMLGTALLLAEYTRHSAFLSRVGLVLSLGFFGVGVWLLWRFARNAMARFEVIVQGHEVVWRTRLGRFEVESSRQDSEQIVAVLVVQQEGAPPRVMLGGPRHAQIAEVFRSRHLDPERLAAWIAEGTALVACRASLEPRGQRG